MLHNVCLTFTYSHTGDGGCHASGQPALWEQFEVLALGYIEWVVARRGAVRQLEVGGSSPPPPAPPPPQDNVNFSGDVEDHLEFV